MREEIRTYGRLAETEAECYLRRKGYRILHRNIRLSAGELDLVVEQKNVLVFVEVKARRTSSHGGAPYAVDARKQGRLIRLAAQYLARHRLASPLCRFDVVLCSGRPGHSNVIEHIENAFEVPGDDLRW
jgi:putative endonuclease